MLFIHKRFSCSILAILGICWMFLAKEGFPQGMPSKNITDMIGRQVTVPAEIKRIVCMGAALRLITYMQAADLVVAVEAVEKRTEAMSQGRPYSLAIREKLKDLPVIAEGGAQARLPDFERLLAVKPDVIFAAGMDSASCEIIQQKTGVPVVGLSYGGTGFLDMDELCKAFGLIADILQRTERAQALSDFIHNAMQDLQARGKKAGADATQKVFVGAVSYRGQRGIESTQAFYPPFEWIGAKNVANELGKPSVLTVSKEQLLLWQPDVIFVDSAGISLVETAFTKEPDFFKMLKAVKANKVYMVLPYNNYHTNIELCLADAYFIGKALYPEAFKDVKIAEKTDQILSFFVGKPVFTDLKQASFGFGRLIFEADGIRQEQFE